MMNYKKGKNVEEELTVDKIPIENLPKNFLWMKVKGGTKMQNVVNYATEAVKKGDYRAVVWSGTGGGVSKTISCAEVMKRGFDMHQITRIHYNLVDEFWDPQIDGLDQLVVKRHIPGIHILLSLDEIDKTVLGYQHSKDKSAMWLNSSGSSKEKRNNNQSRRNNPYRGNGERKSNNQREGQSSDEPRQTKMDNEPGQSNNNNNNNNRNKRKKSSNFPKNKE